MPSEATRFFRPTQWLCRIARGFAMAMGFFVVWPTSAAEESTPPSSSDIDIDSAPHFYRGRTPRDCFTRALATIENNSMLDRASEKAFVMSFLKFFGVPASSQMLVFSTTSLQLRFISPANPRAIFFNEDMYVGYIPGGRLEVVALDPELGAIFYIFDIPRGDGPIRFERSERCMNCHVSDDTGHIPGLVIKSVIPGPGGGSLDAFRSGQSGHGIPFSERFGGWHVTGRHGVTNHWGNLTGRYVAGVINSIPNPPGQRFQFEKYPAKTSDILAHLLHEHQAGFVNRVVAAGYRARTGLFLNDGQMTPTLAKELDEQAHTIVRYMLFADEVPLPAGGVDADPAFKNDFLHERRATTEGLSLKDLDLTTHLFKHRCSYMIYSAVFQGLPREMKSRVYDRLKQALREGKNDPEFAYLPGAEKKAIRGILRATVKDLSAGF